LDFEHWGDAATAIDPRLAHACPQYRSEDAAQRWELDRVFNLCVYINKRCVERKLNELMQ
jgi:hypothetical protein